MPWARGFCPFRAYWAYMIATALYLCFTLRPAIFNSLRPVTVGSGRVGKTCESSVTYQIIMNLLLSEIPFRIIAIEIEGRQAWGTVAE